MADKSWGVSPPGTPGFRIRTNDTPAERAAQRAAAREARAGARAASMAQRLEARAADRDAATRASEDARTARRDAERQLATGDPHAAAASRHRRSGRKDVVREHRDTTGYTTLVDAARVRALADRGTSIAGLAGAFGITEAAVERLLADPPSPTT